MITRKLYLDVDSLEVDSFHADADLEGRGTVEAHGYTEPGYPSCDLTCGASPPPDTALCDVEGTKITQPIMCCV